MFRYKKFLVCIVIGLLVILNYGCSSSSEPKSNVNDYVPVETIKVKLDTISSSITLGGIIEPNKTIPVISTIPGEVKEVFVSEGDYVTKGQVLFTLENSNAKTQLDRAEQALNSTYSNYKNITNQVIDAEKNLSIAKELHNKDILSNEQYQQVQYLASSKPIDIAYQAMIQAQNLYNTAKQLYDSTKVEALDSGLVSFVNVYKEGRVPIEQPSIVIQDMSYPIINLEVSESYINKVNENDIVDVWIPAADYGTSGKIIGVSSMKNYNSMLYPIKIMLESVNSSVKSSMYAEVEIDTDRYEQVIAIPSEAIFVENYKSFVYVIRDNIAYKREVKKDMVTNDLTIISQGLNAGDNLVIKGQFYLSHGREVKIVQED